MTVTLSYQMQIARGPELEGQCLSVIPKLSPTWLAEDDEEVLCFSERIDLPRPWQHHLMLPSHASSTSTFISTLGTSPHNLLQQTLLTAPLRSCCSPHLVAT